MNGRLLYYSTGVPVSGVSVGGAPTRGTAPLLTVTSDGNGNYAMGGVPPGTWAVEPSLTDTQTSIFRGVSSLDATWIQEYMVGLRTFTPAQFLATDTTGNGTMSSLDAVRIQELRVGAISRLPVAANCASDWVFLPAPGPQGDPTAVAPVPAPPPCVRGAITYAALSAGASGQDFQAILFGDCTGNWTPESGGGAIEAEGLSSDGGTVAGETDPVTSLPVPPACDAACAVLIPETPSAPPGATSEVILGANHLAGVQAADLVLDLPPGIDVTRVSKGELAAGGRRCSLVWNASQRQLKISLACLHGIDGGGALLSLTVKATASTSGTLHLAQCALDEGEVPCETPEAADPAGR